VLIDFLGSSQFLVFFAALSFTIIDGILLVALLADYKTWDRSNHGGNCIDRAHSYFYCHRWIIAQLWTFGFTCVGLFLYAGRYKEPHSNMMNIHAPQDLNTIAWLDWKTFSATSIINFVMLFSYFGPFNESRKMLDANKGGIKEH